MEYGKYQIVKIDDDGEQVINTYKGPEAMEDALEEFMSWCADHEEDDQWVAKKYRNMLEGYDGEGMQELLDWLDRNGYIEETFLSNDGYTLKMKDMSEVNESKSTWYYVGIQWKPEDKDAGLPKGIYVQGISREASFFDVMNAVKMAYGRQPRDVDPEVAYNIDSGCEYFRWTSDGMLKPVKPRKFNEAASALFDKSYVEVVKITDGGKEESRYHWYDLD